MRKIAGYFVITLVVLLVLYFPIFLHLTKLPIRLWDESRLAMSAYEMLNNGNYLVVYFFGEPDMVSVKPPLMIWLQSLFMNIFGVGELAVRLPSALASFFTALGLIFSLKRITGSYLIGVLSSFVLVTSAGYISIHGTRTGDYDALLTFFTTFASISLFVFLKNNRNRYLYAFFILLALAVLTKSISGLMFLPAFLFYILLNRKFIPLLKNKHFYLGLLCFFILTFSYYLSREIVNPGYLKAVWFYDMFGRYFNTLAGHSHPFNFYFENLIDKRFSYWYIWAIAGIILGLSIKEHIIIKKLTLFSSLIVISYLVIVSMSETKINWYDLPVYPFLSIITAIAIYTIIKFIESNVYIKKYFKRNTISFVIIIILFLMPYINTIDEIYYPKEKKWNKNLYRLSYYLRDVVKENRELKDYKICHKGAHESFYAPYQFYMNILNERGNNIIFLDKEKVQKDQQIIAHQKEVKNYIEKNYNFEIIKDYYNIRFYKIKNRK